MILRLMKFLRYVLRYVLGQLQTAGGCDLASRPSAPGARVLQSQNLILDGI